MQVMLTMKVVLFWGSFYFGHLFSACVNPWGKTQNILEELYTHLVGEFFWDPPGTTEGDMGEKQWVGFKWSLVLKFIMHTRTTVGCHTSRNAFVLCTWHRTEPFIPSKLVLVSLDDHRSEIKTTAPMGPKQSFIKLIYEIYQIGGFSTRAGCHKQSYWGQTQGNVMYDKWKKEAEKKSSISVSAFFPETLWALISTLSRPLH